MAGGGNSAIGVRPATGPVSAQCQTSRTCREVHVARSTPRGLARGSAGSLGIAANARHHCHEAVGPLRSQVIVEVEFSQCRDSIDVKYFVCRLAGIDREENGHQSTNDVRIAVADEGEPRHAVGMNGRRQPDLADAALYLRFRRPKLVRKRLQLSSELDDVAVAVLPVFEKFEVRDNVLKRGEIRLRCSVHAPTIDPVGASCEGIGERSGKEARRGRSGGEEPSQLRALLAVGDCRRKLLWESGEFWCSR